MLIQTNRRHFLLVTINIGKIQPSIVKAILSPRPIETLLILLSWSSLEPLIPLDLVSMKIYCFRGKVHCYYCWYVISQPILWDVPKSFVATLLICLFALYPVHDILIPQDIEIYRVKIIGAFISWLKQQWLWLAGQVSLFIYVCRFL